MRRTDAVAEIGDKIRIRDPQWFVEPPWANLIGQTGYVERISYGEVRTRHAHRHRSPPRKYWIRIAGEIHGPYPAAAIEKLC